VLLIDTLSTSSGGKATHAFSSTDRQITAVCSAQAGVSSGCSITFSLWPCEWIPM